MWGGGAGVSDGAYWDGDLSNRSGLARRVVVARGCHPIVNSRLAHIASPPFPSGSWLQETKVTQWKDSSETLGGGTMIIKSIIFYI